MRTATNPQPTMSSAGLNDGRINTMRGLVLHKPLPSESPTPFSIPAKPFPFLNLPIELQQLILTHYFGLWSIVMDQQRYSMFRSKYLFDGLPHCDILLTCRAVYRIADPIRRSCFTGHLTLKSVFLLIPLRKKPDLEWLKTNIRTLRFEDSSINPERWMTYFMGFDKLQYLEIDNPNIIRLGLECLDLHAILDGQIVVPLTANMEGFRIGLVNSMRDIVSVVVGQRYCLRTNLIVIGWTGILSARIALTKTGIEIQSLDYDSDATVISKTEFSRPREL